MSQPSGLNFCFLAAGYSPHIHRSVGSLAPVVAEVECVTQGLPPRCLEPWVGLAVWLVRETVEMEERE